MENEILAPRAGLVRDLTVAPGDGVTSGQLICSSRRATRRPPSRPAGRDGRRARRPPRRGGDADVRNAEPASIGRPGSSTTADSRPRDAPLREPLARPPPSSDADDGREPRRACARDAPAERDRGHLPAGTAPRAGCGLAGPRGARGAADPSPPSDPPDSERLPRSGEAAPAPRGHARAVPRRAGRPDGRGRVRSQRRSKFRQVEPVRRARRRRRGRASGRAPPGGRLRLRPRVPHLLRSTTC